MQVVDKIFGGVLLIALNKFIKVFLSINFKKGFFYGKY